MGFGAGGAKTTADVDDGTATGVNKIFTGPGPAQPGINGNAAVMGTNPWDNDQATMFPFHEDPYTEWNRNRVRMGAELDRERAFSEQSMAQEWQRYNDLANGNNSAAMTMMGQGVGMAQQQANAAAAARGNNPMAMRAAAYAGGQMQAQNIGQMAAMRAQEMAAAWGGVQNARGAHLGTLGRYTDYENALQGRKDSMTAAREGLAYQQEYNNMIMQQRRELAAAEGAREFVGTVIGVGGQMLNYGSNNSGTNNGSGPGGSGGYGGQNSMSGKY